MEPHGNGGTAADQGTHRGRPVVFIPGVGHPTSGWTLLQRHLEREGFGFTSAFPGDAQQSDLPHLADQLAHHVETMLALSGASQVHLVGHNVGGMVARYYVQLLGGERSVAGAVTIATPHGGTTAVHGGWGPAAAQLRHGSSVLRHLDESVRPTAVRWISYFSEHDPFVQPASSAVLRHPLLRADNVLVTGHPALGVVIPAFVGRSVARHVAVLDDGRVRPRSAEPVVSRLEPAPWMPGIEPQTARSVRPLRRVG